MRRDECETHRALDADWWVSPEVLLLREVELSGRVAAWFARIALPLMAILIWLLYL